MCLSGNEMPRWCHDWTIFNPVQFTEYPRALAFHPRMHGLDILSGGSKHYHVTGRRYVHPEDTAGGSAQFSHNMAFAPVNIDLFVRRYAHWASLTRAEASTSSTIVSITAGSIGFCRRPRSSSNRKSSMSFRIWFSMSRSFCHPILRWL